MQTSRAHTAGTWLIACLASAVILAYAALLPRARWQGDEFFALALMRDGGWAFQKSFYFGWSPRLFSNVLYAAYGTVVNATLRPLAASCMGLLWIGLGLACLIPAWRAQEDRWRRACLGLVIFALFLAGHDVTEVFYWPGGGISYIPTLAGIVWLFWCCADGSDAEIARPVSATAALVVVAGSSEVGIFAALSICACTGLAQIRRGGRAIWWLAPGLVVALLDLALLMRGRVGTIEIAGLDAPTTHHAIASVLAALPQFGKTLFTPESERTTYQAAGLSIAARVVLLIGSRHLFRRTRDGVLLLPFAAALLLCVFATIASAYYQFGTLCCARHDTMRACCVTIAIISLGAWSAHQWPPRAIRQNVAQSACIAVLLLLAAPRTADILADIRTIPLVISARAQSWQSGRAPGPDMVFTQEPAGRIVASAGFRPGSFVRAATTPWFDTGLLNFFGKQRVTIVVAPPDQASVRSR